MLVVEVKVDERGGADRPLTLKNSNSARNCSDTLTSRHLVCHEYMETRAIDLLQKITSLVPSPTTPSPAKIHSGRFWQVRVPCRSLCDVVSKITTPPSPNTPSESRPLHAAAAICADQVARFNAVLEKIGFILLQNTSRYYSPALLQAIIDADTAEALSHAAPALKQHSNQNHAAYLATQKIAVRDASGIPVFNFQNNTDVVAETPTKT
jgi:hypothetical protein